MRLLIITQKVDKDDPILGFFHGWICAFAKKFKSIVVVCLEKNRFQLPDNVTVLSLGKERWRSKAKYIFLLFYFSLRYANRYDAVFVHMNEEYVVLAGWLWRIMGKRVYMWRNHYSSNRMTDIASIFCNKMFCTSAHSYIAKYKKTVLMPVGIDTNIFKIYSQISRSASSILYLGRIAPSKNIDILVEALILLKKDNIVFTADIYGNSSVDDLNYLEGLKERVKASKSNGCIFFHDAVSNMNTPSIYNSHEVFVNLSPDGMYDKTIFESMLCGCLVIASSDDLKKHIDNKFILSSRDINEISRKIVNVLSMDVAYKRANVLNNIKFAETQNLSRLSERLSDEITL